MDEPGPEPKVLIADKGYDSDAIREISHEAVLSRHPAAQEPQSTEAHRRLHLRAPQSHRTLLLKTQAKPQARNPIR